MADLTSKIQDQTAQGLDVAFDSCDEAGDKFANSGTIYIIVKNGDSSDHTVTIASPKACNQGYYHDEPVVVPAGKDRHIGVFATNRFNDSSGFVNIAYSAVTGMTIAVIKLV